MLYNKLQNETYPTTCPTGYTCTNKSNIKCKRITSSYLHTETCEQASNYCVDAGYTDIVNLSAPM